ncbi:MAG: peptide chain release factor 2 [Candidatus Kerfeldbacteria bacterium CG15_BIG_FIL_POST_REV_8_21_14_020_45_12]|uniref:Peptide chain release factor 2 n=1 Tax=Candidatus Kerfeldbacteria bacterium CG15_BIG_FIL_POST_REV_8_21_14_020_45_12 TaxID=2014247 RepID=A0A2M7H3N3_9BACT|nr:MAG: peptide chain release factor 2 [Candidatus Kerfeldbacteria bacterium CG15_BIG_FIL_POST_REV_8_21_14_020_45_12]PJA93457.1 MAG: peptide chain release factor 2 [Candidatus Kerfeldbacteria bacterium CG_4_9_14_3_um_filter_45_8]
MDLGPLIELKDKINQTWDLLKLDDTRQQVLDLEALSSDPDFWNDQEKAASISRQLTELQNELATWEQIRQEVIDAIDIGQLAEAEGDSAVEKEVLAKIEELSARFADLEFYILLSEPHDASDAIVAVHAGAGGDDAQDWAEMLLRMVMRFCEKRNWKVDVLEQSRGGEAGIKSALLRISGRYAYGYLKSEHGTHRLVRISPFDSEGMRHTSFANIEVIPDLGEVDEIELDESELRIDVFRSGGNGGQSVNTTDSAVRIVHIPTGITVVCQNEKSQHQNKASAFKILKSRLHQKYEEEKEAERKKLRGEYHSAEWGNQIRSYVLHPYKMVKDHRTNFEVKNPDAVLDGELSGFMEAYLRWLKEQA